MLLIRIRVARRCIRGLMPLFSQSFFEVGGQRPIRSRGLVGQSAQRPSCRFRPPSIPRTSCPLEACSAARHRQSRSPPRLRLRCIGSCKSRRTSRSGRGKEKASHCCEACDTPTGIGFLIMPLRLLVFQLSERLRAVLQRKLWIPCGGFLLSRNQAARHLRVA